MESRNLTGMEARNPQGEVVGRISETVLDEETDTVTHVVLETAEDRDRIEVPLSAISVDEDADFATFHADGLDEEPGDHLGDEVDPEGYAPLEVEDGGPDDSEDEGQLVTLPDDENDALSPEEVAREDWTDEEDTPDSGFPRNDVYVDPETGEEEVDPALKDNETLADDVADLISETTLSVESAEDGIVVLAGTAESQGYLQDVLTEIMELDGVLGADSGDVEIGS